MAIKPVADTVQCPLCRTLIVRGQGLRHAGLVIPDTQVVLGTFKDFLVDGLAIAGSIRRHAGIGELAQALTLLRAAGWTRVAHLPGGMTVWPEA